MGGGCDVILQVHGAGPGVKPGEEAFANIRQSSCLVYCPVVSDLIGSFICCQRTEGVQHVVLFIGRINHEENIIERPPILQYFSIRDLKSAKILPFFLRNRISTLGRVDEQVGILCSEELVVVVIPHQ